MGPEYKERNNNSEVFDFDYPTEPEEFNPSILMERALMYGIALGCTLGLVLTGVAHQEVVREVPSIISGNATANGVAGGYVLIAGGIVGGFLGIFGGLTVGSIMHNRHYRQYLPTS